MPYKISGEEFRTKNDIKSRCRKILQATPDGQFVSGDEHSFLVDLFQHHEEWQEKAGNCNIEITTRRTAQGSRCFVIVRADTSKIDISFDHAVTKIPTTRSQRRQQQYLKDYKNAARTAIKEQVSSFRRQALAGSPKCPIARTILTSGNSEVDHIAPLTFDKLLHDFTKANGIDPSSVVIGSIDGTIAYFVDEELSANWASYHKERAQLRLISKEKNRRLKSPKVSWECVSVNC